MNAEEEGKIFSLLFEKTLDPLAILDTDLSLIRVNSAFGQLFGKTIEDITNKRFIDLFTKEGAEFISKNMVNSLKSNHFWLADITQKNENTEKAKYNTITININAYSLTDEVTIIICRDITEFRIIQQEKDRKIQSLRQIYIDQNSILNLSRDQKILELDYHEAIKLCLDLILNKFQQGRISFWNYNGDNLIIKDSIVPPNNPKYWIIEDTEIDLSHFPEFTKAINSDKPFFFDHIDKIENLKFLKQNFPQYPFYFIIGIPIHFHGSLKVVVTIETYEKISLSEDIFVFFEMIVDIIIQLIYNHQLRESERRYRQLFQNLPTGVITIDNTGKILDVNPALVNLLGSPSVEATKTINMFDFPPLVKAGVSQDFKNALLTGKVSTSSHPYRSKWGKDLYFRYHLNPIYDSKSKTYTKLFGIVEDITDYKNAQNRLMQAQKMDSLGILAGGIAHDFNNMLGGIIGYASLLKLDEEDADKLASIEGILNAAKSASELTQKLLGFGQRGKNLSVAVDLNSTINQVLEIVYHSIDPKIEISLKLDPLLHSVDADPSQMKQVFMNLIINAVEACGTNGLIEIKTSNFNEIEEIKNKYPEITIQSYVKIEIKDNGQGFSKEVQGHIFEPFFTTKNSGKGLGLATVYGIIQSHKAYIFLDSEENAGARFTLLFPYGNKLPQSYRKSVKEVESGKGLILVIEDEFINREMIKKQLEKLDYHAITAENGKVGLELYKLHQQDIVGILLDLRMPIMNGCETMEKLIQLNPDVKVLLMTGYGINEQAQKVLDMGAKTLIPKPFDIQTLSEMITTHF